MQATWIQIWWLHWTEICTGVFKTNLSYNMRFSNEESQQLKKKYQLILFGILEILILPYWLFHFFFVVVAFV